MHNSDRKDFPIAIIGEDELVSIKRLEENLGDKYFLIAYEKK